ncbi:MAG: hypothetical protein ACPG4T_17510 [Nannocystaceae bacterium]
MKGRTIIGLGLGLGAVGLAGTGWYAWNTVRLRSPDFDSSLPLRGELEVDNTTENWGKTPDDLIPSFALMEEATRVPGLARLACLISYMETEWEQFFHDQSSDAVFASSSLYKLKKETRPPLKFGKEAAAFGRGGLFALPGSAFLWAGVDELKERAPFLPYRPGLMTSHTRTSLFAAAIYITQLIKRAVIEDTTEVVIGWLDESLLSAQGHGSEAYQQVRRRVEFAAQEIGIDLDAIAMVDANAYPGAQSVFERIVLKSRGPTP